MSTGLWIPSEDLRPETCRCIWTSYGDTTGGWWRHYTQPNCPLHGIASSEQNEKEDTE